MSQAGASLLLVVVLFVFAIYLVFWPPEGFEENLVHRAAIPFVLVATAYGVLENLRTRAHMGQLIGAIRGLLGKAPASPAVKAEAIAILLQSLKSGPDQVLLGDLLFESPTGAWARGRHVLVVRLEDGVVQLPIDLR